MPHWFPLDVFKTSKMLLASVGVKRLQTPELVTIEEIQDSLPQVSTSPGSHHGAVAAAAGVGGGGCLLPFPPNQPWKPSSPPPGQQRNGGGQ